MGVSDRLAMFGGGSGVGSPVSASAAATATSSTSSIGSAPTSGGVAFPGLVQYHVGAPVSTHCWNKDATKVAYSPNDDTMIIASVADSRLTVEAETSGAHTSRVMCVDWAPESNRIVTCAEDRNAFVWEYRSGEWRKELVVTRLQRAATCVRWAPNEKVFAIGSQERIVIAYESDGKDAFLLWTTGKALKGIASTVLAVAWAPKLPVLAAATADFKCHLFCGLVKGVKGVSKPKEDSPWGGKWRPSGHLTTIDMPYGCGWIRSLQFSPSGGQLALSMQGSTIAVVTPGGANPTPTGEHNPVQLVRASTLAFRSLVWLSEKAFVAVGDDQDPVVFARTASGFQFLTMLDPKSKSGGTKKVSASATANAFKMFQDRAAFGDGHDAKSTDHDTVHQNTVLEVRAVTKEGDKVTVFSTAGLDGLIIHWDVRELEKLHEVKIL